MRITDIPLHDRPRERLVREGSAALSDAELLAIILGKGTSEENAIMMARKILSAHGIDRLRTAPVEWLTRMKGVGVAKASRIKASFEFASRVASQSKPKRIGSASDVFQIAHPKLAHLERENLMIILLDSKHNVLKEEIISVGTSTSSIAHPREIFKSAVRLNSSALILVHNHPSGNVKPSEDDIEITRKLKASGELLGIDFLDHVIIGRDSYFSFAENKHL